MARTYIFTFFNISAFYLSRVYSVDGSVPYEPKKFDDFSWKTSEAQFALEQEMFGKHVCLMARAKWIFKVFLLKYAHEYLWEKNVAGHRAIDRKSMFDA